MSLAMPQPAASQRPKPYQKTLSSTSHITTSSSIYSDDSFYDRVYDLEDDETLTMEDPVQTKTAVPAAVMVPVTVDANTTLSRPPSLPQKHNLRASRLLDAMTLGKTLSAMLEPGMTTPHDVYLSSEEDASSSADDFSDYEYESASEEFAEEQQSPSTPESPAAFTHTRRGSHEVTARVVSVVFSGKPSVIEVPRRIGTPESSRASDSDLAATSKRLSTVLSNKSHEDILASIPTQTVEAATPRSSPHSSLASRSLKRRSNVFSTILHGGKPRPPFLSIDPFANGSTYSLDLPREDTTHSHTTEQEHHHIPYYPKSPTALFKRTISTIRRRSSRQALNTTLFDSPPPPSRSSTMPFSGTSSLGYQPPQRPSVRPMSFYSSSSTAESTVSEASTERSGPPPSPVTYNDIIKAAKRNAHKAPPPVLQRPSLDMRESRTRPPVPESPTTQKKGMMKLRRRSQRIVNGHLV